MTRRSCDGEGLLRAFRSAVDAIEASVDELNALNVYPVPDGDTGSNMLATVRAALEEGERVGGDQADRVAAAISFGALMGARGNSGVILSQVFRGISEGFEGKHRFNGLDVANALSMGSRTAYAAVVKPVEGTILTVVRESAAAAVEAAERENDIEVVVRAALEAADRALARTPSLLPVLREAGVVDAGGAGFYRVLQGVYRQLTGDEAGAPGPSRAIGPRPSAVVAHADEGFGYETMYLLEAGPGRSLDLDAIRRHLEGIGESVLVAGDARAVKIHVHSERPDVVVAYGLDLGTLSRISIENLDRQATDVRAGRGGSVAVAPLASGSADAPHGSGWAEMADQGTGAAPSPDGTPAAPAAATPGPRVPLAVVAVASGDGLAAIFESFGVSAVVRGGQSANPSTGELLKAVSSIAADEVLVLPNNPNVVMAARQAAQLTDRPVHVVPTRNAAEGVAALLALDPSLGGGANIEPMTEAGRAVQTLQVTEAVRDAKVDGRKVKRGHTLVLDPDDGLVAVDPDRERSILAGIDALRPGYELLTLYYGEGVDLSAAEDVARRIAEHVPDVEVEVVRGGQAHYAFLLAAE
ncbi:MAG: DAK2 domain-containing protein [Chloroflexi bacterium]|nr:DAK2 domain-containing protein [Chloroflexota bacterium]